MQKKGVTKTDTENAIQRMITFVFLETERQSLRKRMMTEKSKYWSWSQNEEIFSDLSFCLSL